MQSQHGVRGFLSPELKGQVN